MRTVLLYSFNYVNVAVCVSVGCRARDTLGAAVSCLTWVLGNRLRFFGRAVCALNHRAIWSALLCLIGLCLSVCVCVQKRHLFEATLVVTANLRLNKGPFPVFVS